jgi:hypothetical protein
VIIRCTEFLIVIEKAGKNYSACSPAFPGGDATGKRQKRECTKQPGCRSQVTFICNICYGAGGIIYHYHTPFFPGTPGKSGPRIRVLFTFLSKNHLWQGTGKEAAGPPFRAILRGAFQPIFGKMPILQTFFPREQNPGPNCCPQRESGIQKMETEPCTGVFGHGGMARGEGLNLEFRIPEVAGLLTCDRDMTRDGSGAQTG